MQPEQMDKHWRRILDTLRDGVMVVGLQGRVLMVNQALCRMTGYQQGELAGRSCTVFNCDACEGQRKPEGGHWCRLFSGRQPENRELTCRFIRKDGSYLPAVKTAALLRDPQGKVLGAVETVSDLSELDRRDKKIGELSRQLAAEGDFMGMVGESPAMLRVFNLITRAAQGDSPVLLQGESGSGKELAARAIHDLGSRREGPYVVFNCAALSQSLFQSEMFGHVKGAFTGAHRHRPGRLEEADGGDLFMDEIGELPVSGQAKLLRVLEDKSFERVGDQRPIQVDVRFIAATNRDLAEMLEQGLFREDLYFRLNVIPITLPPLRERKEDLPILVEHFLAKLRQSTGKQIVGVSPNVMQRFMGHGWPGNVRELRTALEYAFVLADRGLIRIGQLPPALAGGEVSHPRPGAAARKAPSPAAAPRPRKPGDEKLRRELLQALRQSGGNQTKAAELLGVSRATVWNRMNRFGIELKKTVG